MFHKEIEVLRDRYNEERQNPNIPRNMPPVSGRIMWIRHFYSRIEEPMNIFKTQSRVIFANSICLSLSKYKVIIYR